MVWFKRGRISTFDIAYYLTVQKCTVALDDPINSIGIIDENGALIPNKNFQLWRQPHGFTEQKCEGCFFSSQCQSNYCMVSNIRNQRSSCPDYIIKNEEAIAKQIINVLKRKELS